MEDVCLGCGEITAAVNDIYNGVLQANCPDTKICTSMCKKYSFMCRHCFGKYQKVIELYSTISVRVKQFVSNTLLKNTEENELQDHDSYSSSTH